MSTIHERIRQARTAKGMTQPELAALMGISPQAVQQWEKEKEGTSPRGKRLELLAQNLGVSPSWLQFGGAADAVENKLRPIAIWNNESDLSADEYVFLPSLDVKLSAGNGTVVWHVDEKGQKQAFTAKWARRMGIDPACAATMVVSGSSMEPRLLDGDSIVVDYCQNDRIIDGKVYALVLGGELYIKRLFKEIDGVRIVSDNPDKRLYPDKVIPADKIEHLKLIGRVIAVSGGV